MGQKPQHSGKVQFEENGERKDVGKIALWDNLEPSNEKSPVMTGTVTIENKIYRVSLWKNEVKNDN